MKNQPGTMKNHKNPPGTLKNHEKPIWNHECDHFFLHTLFITHGGIQPTFRTQLEKVLIFRHTLFLLLTGVPTDLLDG